MGKDAGNSAPAIMYRASWGESGRPILQEECRVPALGAVASARRQLRTVLASHGRTFFALVEARGAAGAAVFRNPEGSARAATVAPQLLATDFPESDHDDEILGAVLLEDKIGILRRGGVMLCSLNPAVRPAEAPKRTLPDNAAMPLGLDPAQLLRMLDMHPED